MHVTSLLVGEGVGMGVLCEAIKRVIAVCVSRYHNDVFNEFHRFQS